MVDSDPVLGRATGWLNGATSVGCSEVALTFHGTNRGMRACGVAVMEFVSLSVVAVIIGRAVSRRIYPAVFIRSVHLALIGLSGLLLIQSVSLSFSPIAQPSR